METVDSGVLYFAGQTVPVDGRVVSIDRLEQFESLDTTETMHSLIDIQQLFRN